MGNEFDRLISQANLIEATATGDRFLALLVEAICEVGKEIQELKETIQEVHK